MEDTIVDSAPVESDNGAALQTEMTGDFFVDDGCGAVVDAMGNPQLNENNEPIKTMDEFSAFRANKIQPQQPTQTAKTGNTATQVQQPQATKFNSVFESNGQINFDAINNQGKVFSGYQYQSSTMPKGQPNEPQEAIKAPVDPVAQIKADVDKYSQELSDVRLKPIENAYNRLVRRYGGEENIPDEAKISLNEEYLEQKEAIRNLVDSKKDELRDKQFKDQLSQKDFQTLEVKSRENFNSVAKEVFKSASPDAQNTLLEELIFGYQVNGKYVPGYGAEDINHIFDRENKGKEFKNPQEWADAYNKFWVDYASNPANIKYIAKKAWANYMESTEGKRRDSYRSAWEQEQSNKMRTQTIQRPNASRGGNIGTPDAATQQIKEFFAPPSRNM